MKPLIPLIAVIPTAFPIYQKTQNIDAIRTEIYFDESRLQKGLLDVSPFLLDYYNGEKFREKFENSDDLFLSDKLYRLVSAWHEETRFTSSLEATIENPKFQRIIKYGKQIIPSILREIDRTPSNLVWALNLITDSRISEKPITIEDACKLWIKWGRHNKLIY